MLRVVPMLCNSWGRLQRRSPSLSRLFSTIPGTLVPPSLKVGDKVAIAVSGGVDSSYSAAILRDAGYDVTAVMMHNWDFDDEHGKEACKHSFEQDLADVQEVCRKLNIKLHQVDFSKEYWLEVFTPFLNMYKSGTHTPNPDVLCNRAVKFHVLKNFVQEKLGIRYLATGHYARLDYSHCPIELGGDYGGEPRLLRGVDPNKDQTYFLSLTHREMFRDVIFPLGHLTKQDVYRQIQQRLPGIHAYQKKESMGICFIGKRSMTEFLGNYINLTAGRFVDWDTGEVIGQHDGMEVLTIGQKARVGGCQEKYYIAGKCTTSFDGHYANRQQRRRGDVFVVKGRDHPLLFTDKLLIPQQSFHWIHNTLPTSTTTTTIHPCTFKTRHGQKIDRCLIELDSRAQALQVRFESPQRALTAGQIFALYDEHAEECLGAAPIPLINLT